MFLSVPPEVVVLLSIYRARTSHLQTQLRSLSDQVGVKIRLIFHVDEDSQEYDDLVRAEFPDAVRVPGDRHLGIPSAYTRLVEEAPVGDFYAFCDQDDIWEPSQLITAIEELAGHENEATLWTCQAEAFADDVRIHLPSKVLAVPENFHLGQVALQTVAPACTLVWNPCFQDILKGSISSGSVLMHDSWALLLGTASGTVISTPRTLVRYRIHESNAIGIGQGVLQRGLTVLNGLGKRRPTFASQARLLLACCRDGLDNRSVGLLEAIADWRQFRLTWFWIRGEIWRQNRRENLLLLLRILLPMR